VPLIPNAITRNPLADPGILGVNLGASLASRLLLFFWLATQLTEFFCMTRRSCFQQFVSVFLLAGMEGGKVDPLKLALARRGRWGPS